MGAEPDWMIMKILQSRLMPVLDAGIVTNAARSMWIRLQEIFDYFNS